MFDYEFTKVDSYKGDGKKVASIEVFNCVTGKTVAFCRRRPFEAKKAWIDRAMQDYQ